ncbi:Thioredoxin [Lacunisphaera limnophila]|uniref:Thioredoxin n=1 Tax=Lacunisphaera limnophila TaxID=1838286 RepID=A0A1I7PHZ7_9BACT|nr:thioredoxin-like domain-containing protein [Lacunisphaera limnophila]AOS43248.1 Thioredoxin [Lacunisphaera limnophila]
MKSRLIALLVSLLLPLASSAAATLEQLAADPQLWPQEVTVTGSAKATVLRNGQPAGMMLIGAGKKLTVTGIAADGVTGKLGGATVRVPVEKTNLLAGGSGPEEVAEEAREETPAPAPALAPGARPAMQRRLAGKLVALAGGGLQPVADGRLDGVKYYALYFSASWCGPCRQFTPGFVQFYRAMKAKHPEFEVVFVSADNSAGEMAGYMKQDGMPWLAMKYDQVPRSPEIQRYSGPGIPCLVLVDANGRVLSDSYDGDNYVGPGKVLQDTQRILKRGS